MFLHGGGILIDIENKEEKNRKEQSSGKSIVELLKQETRIIMMANQHQRSSKMRYRGMEI